MQMMVDDNLIIIAFLILFKKLATCGTKHHQVSTLRKNHHKYPCPVDTFNVYHTNWNIQILVDQLSVLHSIQVQKCNS